MPTPFSALCWLKPAAELSSSALCLSVPACVPALPSLCLQAAAGTEPTWFNVLPLAVAGFAKNKLGLKSAPEFKRFEDVLTLFKPVSAAGGC